MYLIKMTDFVIIQNEKLKNPRDGHIPSGRLDYIMAISNYANFLIKPLEMGMFYPCDGNGNFLKEKKPMEMGGGLYDAKQFIDYQTYLEAKKKVLFQDNNFSIPNIKDYLGKRIEQCLHLNLYLLPAQQKKLGL